MAVWLYCAVVYPGSDWKGCVFGQCPNIEFLPILPAATSSWNNLYITYQLIAVSTDYPNEYLSVWIALLLASRLLILFLGVPLVLFFLESFLRFKGWLL